MQDGHFVPNFTFGPPVVKSLRKHTKGFLDCHIMATQPEAWVKDFAEAGADMFTFHLESLLTGARASGDGSDAVKEMIDKLRSHSMHVGIAISPETPVEAVLPYCSLIDMVLVMTVKPGFGGQSYMPECAEKCKAIRTLHPQMHIQVDGGLAPSTVQHAASCGANVIVAGSAIFGADDPKSVISALREAVDVSTGGTNM